MGSTAKSLLSWKILKMQNGSLVLLVDGAVERRNLREVFQGRGPLRLPLELYVHEEGREEREWPSGLEEPGHRPCLVCVPAHFRSCHQ